MAKERAEYNPLPWEGCDCPGCVAAWNRLSQGQQMNHLEWLHTFRETSSDLNELVGGKRALTFSELSQRMEALRHYPPKPFPRPEVWELQAIQEAEIKERFAEQGKKYDPRPRHPDPEWVEMQQHRLRAAKQEGVEKETEVRKMLVNETLPQEDGVYTFLGNAVQRTLRRVK